MVASCNVGESSPVAQAGIKTEARRAANILVIVSDDRDETQTSPAPLSAPPRGRKQPGSWAYKLDLSPG